jgi:hypothetical protein
MQTAASNASRFSLVIEDIVRKVFESIETQLDSGSVSRISNNLIELAVPAYVVSISIAPILSPRAYAFHNAQKEALHEFNSME